MRLHSFHIQRFRNLHNVTVSAAPLTVLIGQNGAGKSNVLQGVSRLITAPQRRGRAIEEHLSGFVLVEFEPPSRILNAYDQIALMSLFGAQRAIGGQILDDGNVFVEDRFEGEAAEEFEPEFANQVNSYDFPSDLLGVVDASFAAAAKRTRLPQELTAAIHPLVRLIFEEPMIAIQPDGSAYLAVDPSRTPDDVVELGQALLGAAAGSPIEEFAASIATRAEGWHLLPLAFENPGRFVIGWRQEAARNLLGSAVIIDPDPERAELELDGAIASIHDICWTPRRTPQARTMHDYFSDPKGWPRELAPLGGVRRANEPPADAFPDTWLERGEDGWTRVRPTVSAVARLIERRANEIVNSLPFLKAQGAIEVWIRPVDLWRGTPSRSEIRIKRHDGHAVHLDRCGSGSQRWIAMAVGEACRELTSARRCRADVEAPDESYAFSVEELIDAAHAGDTDGLMRLVPRNRMSTLVIDEPEQHLHPLAVAEVGDWLAARSDDHLGALVATHSPLLLRRRRERIEFIGVVPGANGAQLIPLGEPTLAEIDEVGAAVGLMPGEALLTAGGLLIVEGPQDVTVLKHFFGDELTRHRVLMIPLWGTNNAETLIDHELLRLLGIPVRVLFDNTRSGQIDRAPKAGFFRKEERALNKVLNAYKDSAIDIRPVPFDVPDVICALPTEAVRAAFPSLTVPTWNKIIDNYRNAKKPENFKDFALRAIGVHDNATIFIRKVLELATPSEGPEPVLRRAFKELLAGLSAEDPSRAL